MWRPCGEEAGFLYLDRDPRRRSKGIPIPSREEVTEYWGKLTLDFQSILKGHIMFTSSLLVATALLVGQADRPSEHLKGLQPLIGQWVCQGVVQSDSPDLGPKGTEFLAVITYTWAIDKNALQIQWVGKSPQKKPVRFVELIGWDGEQKKMVSQGFASTGSVEHNVWTRDGKVIVCHTKGINAEGKSVTLRYLHEIDGDTMTFRLVDITVDGEKQPNEEYKYRRVR